MEAAILFVATLLAADCLRGDQVAAAADALDQAGCAPIGWAWLDEGSAADIPFGLDPAAARAVLEGGAFDVVVQPMEGRAKRLLIADMDSTMIQCECIDELADYAGVKAEVAAITERAMQGELDFAGALKARVALLAGLPETVLEDCYRERVRPMPGARALVRTMAARGARTILVSGGFHYFAARVAGALGFHQHVANTLNVRHGRLDGTVGEPIVGADTKLRVLEDEVRGLDGDRAASLAVGDGANDLPMIRAAGLGVAFHAKPVVAAAADARIERGDLTALLWAQGIPRRDWVS